MMDLMNHKQNHNYKIKLQIVCSTKYYMTLYKVKDMINHFNNNKKKYLNKIINLKKVKIIIRQKIKYVKKVNNKMKIIKNN